MELEELRLGGAQVLASVFEQHRARLRKMVEFRLDRRVSARVSPDDILQESFVEASCRLEEYLADASVPIFIWLRFLTAQQVLRVHRRHLGAGKRSVGREVSRHRDQLGRQTDQIVRHLLATDTTPSMVVSRLELQQSIRERIDRLDDIDRGIIVLRHYEELSNVEAAIELSISKTAASKRYTRALKRLRSSIERNST